MNTGTGLFLGLVFCGTVFLFSQTKDRWDWGILKKIGKWLAISFLVIITITLVYEYIDDNKENAQIVSNSPKITNELMGIKLNDSFKDIEFKFGRLIPSGFSDDIEESYLKRLSTPDLELIAYGEFDKLSEGGIKILSEKFPALQESIAEGDFKFQSKTSPQINLRVFVKSKKIEAILYECADYDDILVNTVGCNTSGESLQKKFDKDIRILCGKNNTNLDRVYDVVRYGVRYYLTQNRVIGFLIAEPKLLESFVKHNYDKCN
jgi:hypothetical protein